MLKEIPPQKSTVPLNSVLKGNDSHGESRRRAVNTMNTNTIEIRVFKGNASKIGFFKNLEFVDSVFEYSKLLRYNAMSEIEKAMHKKRLSVGSIGQEMDIYGIPYTDYLKWLEKEKSGNYMNLKLWLSKNGIIKKLKEKKYTSATPKNKVIVEADIMAVA